jgi:hypothetical protein
MLRALWAPGELLRWSRGIVMDLRKVIGVRLVRPNGESELGESWVTC